MHRYIIYYTIFLIFSASCFAGEMWLDVDKKKVEWSEKYSFQDYSGKSLQDEKDLKNIYIRGSNFYQENKPNSRIFPDDMKGVTFVECNLDNCYIPEGNYLMYSTNKNIMVQEDKEDWVLDGDLKPVKKVNEVTAGEFDTLNMRKNEK